MADAPFENNSNVNCHNNSEAVCIDVDRVYDSCGDKDCLSDLQVYCVDEQQAVLDNAVNVRLKDVDIITVCVDTEPVPFHRGFYSVDMTFFFDVTLDAYINPGTAPVKVEGLSIYNKKVILYGSEGNVKTFSSELCIDEFDPQNSPSSNLPKATVQVARPIGLSAKLKEKHCKCTPPCKVPKGICCYFGGEFKPQAEKIAVVTIGIFTIVQLERSVQLLVPSYDFCIPEKECVTSSDNPCEMFNRLDFPTAEFFPPNVSDIGSDDSSSSHCTCK